MINAGAGYNLNDLNNDIRDLVNAALRLKSTAGLMDAKLARVSPQDIADLNPTYPEPGVDAAAQTTNRVAHAQKIKDALAEVKAMVTAYVPAASYDVASGRPLD